MNLTCQGIVGRLWLAAGILIGACSSPGGFAGAFDAAGGSADASLRSDGAVDATTRLVTDSGGLPSDAKSACPSSCAKLKASCGEVTDTICGGVVQCGGCPSGMSCGGGGVHNVCGSGSSNPDASCTPKSCSDQGLSCGQATDGCGKTLVCGACSAAQTCGGDPMKPGECGCTGECSNVVACDAGSPTTLTGKVYDPAGLHPLFNVLVYIPNDPTDSGLQPFKPGVTCSQCGATAAGNPLVTALTAPNGTFTLTNVPVGAHVPLVIQLGRWRRQFQVDTSNACASNAVPDMTLKMPATHLEGDIPFIGILTGAYDPVECVLRKIGIADSEFTDPGGPGHINFYLAGAADNTCPPGAGCLPSACGAGASITGSTPQQPSLFGTTGGAPTIDQYDMVILECECYAQAQSAADQAALLAYTSAGGRVFASDYAYSWLYQNADFATVAAWDVNQDGMGSTRTGKVDLTSNPQGQAFNQWLVDVGVSTNGSASVGSLAPVYHNTDGVSGPTQQWLYWKNALAGAPIQFTFNTPVGAPSDQQCGRVVYNDWHAQTGVFSSQATFPNECAAAGTTMTPQDTALEFMIFDLAACVQPYTPVCSPSTCMVEGVACGPASDGCGKLLDCGSCPTGQTCGGGGAGKCGTSVHCTPETCTSQGIQCGQAGDGCGNVIDCGNCATGAICGANGPGKCGMIQ